MKSWQKGQRSMTWVKRWPKGRKFTAISPDTAEGAEFEDKRPKCSKWADTSYVERLRCGA